MDDWKEGIKESYDRYQQRFQEIDQVLKKLINEFKTSPYEYLNANIENCEEEKLKWYITIGDKKVIISDEDIKEKENANSEYLTNEECNSMDEVIKEIISSKFKW